MKDLGKFLERYPRYSFDIVEHIELGGVIEVAKKKFFEMSSSIGHCVGESVWDTRREALQGATRGLAAYSEIDWYGCDYPANVPMIDKEHVLKNSDSFLAPDHDPERCWHRPTSGTSGRPLTIYYSTEYSSEFHYFGVSAALLHAGLFEATLCKGPFHCLALIDHKDLDDRIWVDPSGLTGATLRIAFDTASPQSAADIGEVLRKHRPAVLSLKPSILELLTSDRTVSISAKSLVAIVSGGAQLSPDLRQRAERILGAPVIDAYGMTEVGAIASSCRFGELHVHESQVILEVLGADNQLRLEGVGELVVTGIRNVAMPMLRYRTGDAGHLVSKPCRCGLPGRRIESLRGRLAPLFRLPDGNLLAPTVFDRLQHWLPIQELQVTQGADGVVDFAIEWMDSGGAITANKLLVEKIVELAGPELAFGIRAVEFTPSEKFQRYRVLSK
jgi:phenylacetate-CoA ligase